MDLASEKRVFEIMEKFALTGSNGFLHSQFGDESNYILNKNGGWMSKDGAGYNPWELRIIATNDTVDVAKSCTSW